MMVGSCANSQCSAQFPGRLFLSNALAGREAREQETVRYYWLCDACCRLFTIQRDGQKVGIVPLRSGRLGAKVHTGFIHNSVTTDAPLGRVNHRRS